MAQLIFILSTKLNELKNDMSEGCEIVVLRQRALIRYEETGLCE